MLIHKKTMGVLDRYWTGEYRTAPDGVAEPVMREFTPEGDRFPPEEWWYVPRGCPLGRKLRRLYPFCVPVTAADGRLLDAAPLPGRRERPPSPAPADKAAGMSRQRRRRTGLLEHILEEDGK